MASKKAKGSARASAKPVKRVIEKAAKSAKTAAKAVGKAAKKLAAKPAKATASKPAKPAAKAAPAKVSVKKKAKSAAAGAARIGVGEKAPSFELEDDTGATVSSDSLRGAPYVLYFYPKDDTPGCTLEACGFRDALPRFGAKGVKVLGVSPDPIASHGRFKKKYGLTFPLLSDPDKTLAKAYGVWVMKQNYGREYMGIERSTFLIDASGKIKEAWRGVRVPGHIDKVFGAL